MNKSNIFGVYNDEEQLIAGVKKVKEKGFTIADVISPYPIEEIFHELKLKTRIPVAAFLYGVFGLLATFGFLYWTSVVNYPLVFGGKPRNTLSFVIVIFVMVINITIASTVVTFFMREKKGPGAVPKYEYDGITDDKYFIVVEKSADLDVDGLSAAMKESGAVEVTEK